MPTPLDPLGIRAGARFVIDHARDVSISDRATARVASQIATRPHPHDDHAAWRRAHLGPRHLDPDSLANFVLVLDALNFSFWGHPRWRVSSAGESLDGYWALTAALTQALDDGYPITDASFLAEISARDVAVILRGESVIPLFSARVQNLREVGQGLLRTADGRFLTLARDASGSAIALLRRVVSDFPSFVDVSHYRSRTIPFYKRAQILISDLAGAFAGTGTLQFHDLGQLTAFADYKVPQVLHHLGVIRYSPRLRSSLNQGVAIPAGSPTEVEIRAATIAAVDRIVEDLSLAGHPVPAYEVDWYLWDLGQEPGRAMLPYHRTRTLAY